MTCLLRLIFRTPRAWLRNSTNLIGDAHRGDGKCYIMRADEKLTAFLELQKAIHQFATSLIS